MAKATTGTKKTKDAIQKAATQKKGGAKKWTKGKVKQKSDHAVFLSQGAYDKMITTIPKVGKHISISTIVEKFKVVGSVARILLKKCLENGSLKESEHHSKQALYYPTIQIAQKTIDPKQAAKKEKAAKKK